MRKLRDEHRRDTIKPRTLLFFDGGERRARIKGFSRINHGRAMNETSQIAHHHPKAMIKRYGNAEAISRNQANIQTDEIAIIENVIMGQRRALWQTGRARRKLNIDRLIGVKTRLDFTNTLAQRGIGPGHQIANRVPAASGSIVNNDDALQVR